MQQPPREFPVLREPTAEIALAPADWLVATWRPHRPAARTTPRPFNRAECMQRLRRVPFQRGYYQPWDWNKTEIQAGLSCEEAHFWLIAMTELGPDQRTAAGPDSLVRFPITGEVSRTEVLRRLRQAAFHLPPQITAVLEALLGPVGLIDLILEPDLWNLQPGSLPHYQLSHLAMNLVDGYRRFVLPTLDEAMLTQVRDRARTRIDTTSWAGGGQMTAAQLAGYRVAPMLGMHRELLALVSSWPDDLFPRKGGYEEWRRLPREVIFGLGDAWQVEQHMRRLGLRLRHEADARAWLAHTETRALDFLVESIRTGAGNRLVETLCLVRSPAVARHLVELRQEGHSCPELRQWLHTQIGNAVVGLLPLAGGRGKTADLARRYLGDLKRRGHADVIEQHLGTIDATLAGRLREQILDVVEVHYPEFEDGRQPIWLRRSLATMPALPTSPVPHWLEADSLPPLVAEERQLPLQVVHVLLRLGEHCNWDARPALLNEVRDRVAITFREPFAWRLVEQWQCGGAPKRDAWVLRLVGYLCADESVLRLVALARDATGTAGRHPGQMALQGLQAIGTALALQQLGGLSRSLRSRPMRQFARALFEQTARQQGLSRVELEDHAVPDLGFTATGGPVFDFGPRQFEVLLMPGPKLLVRDGQGAIRDDLPSPGVRDDQERAREAVVGWRKLRRGVREVWKEQGARLERAMVTGQRWALRDFQHRVLAQPLLARLARFILWAAYDDRARLAVTFRINEELQFVDRHEMPVSLAIANSIRIPHPIELDDEVRAGWQTVWRDHELVPPFEQLGRRIFRLRPEQKTQTGITDFNDRKISALTLAGLVKAQDWDPATLSNARTGEAHRKYFSSAALTAVLHHPSVGQHRYPDPQAVQVLQQAFFLRDMIGPRDAVDQAKAIPLSAVPDLVRSEVCELLALVHGKGRE